MEQLAKLITSLRAFTIIIIENAFIYEMDAEKVLAKFCFLPAKNREKILKFITDNGNPLLAESLTLFTANFLESNRNATLEESMPATEYFKKYLVEINATTLNENKVIAEIDTALKADEANILKDLFLKFGIYSSADEAGYEQLIKAISQIENISISIFKAQPTEAELELFFEHIDKTCEETGSEFCLAIIDKKLMSGVSEDEGKSFIKEEIVPRNANNSTKIICCLYTSNPDINLKLDGFTDYFIQEIGKGAPDKYEKITKTLARSAYAQVFNILKNQHVKSAENALEMVLKNQKNIKYIIEHSHKEGIPGIEAIKYWFNLAQQYQFDNEQTKELKFFSGIINFFQNEYLEDHPHTGAIGLDLKKLNSFELFENNTNEKYLPIAPGDIFKIGDDYYILMGQLCDLLLRSDNTRKAKLAELLKINFVDMPSSEEKFFVEVISDRKYIIIRNFPLNGDYKNISIDISTNTTEFADLKALDLVMFNESGEARVDLNSDINIEALKILPQNMTHYYIAIQKEYMELQEIKIKTTNDISALVNDNIKFSSLKFSEKDGVIELAFSRVARLKGRYYDSVHNNFLNNKGRIDLNLIDNSPEYVTQIKLFCKFYHDETSLHEIENVNLWQSGEKTYFKRQELIDVLPDTFKAILNLCPEILIFGTQKQYDLSEDGVSGELNFKYLVNPDVFQGKPHYSYKSLFGESKPTTNPNFKVDGEDDVSFINETGNAAVPLTIEQLKKGVIVYEKKLKLQLTNGILTRTQIEKDEE